VVIHDQFKVQARLHVDVIGGPSLLAEIVVVRVVDALVFEVQILDFIDSQIDGLNDEVSLERKACIVGHRFIVVELDEELIILEAFHDSLDHTEVVRSADVILESV
jgi:hypothetical protein